MRHAVIIDALRTPVGKASSDTGYYRSVRADDLSAQCMKALVERTRIDPHLIEDVRWGCVMQQGEQGIDIARIAHFDCTGLTGETAGVTINRNCAFGIAGHQRLRDEYRRRPGEDVQIATAGSSTWTPYPHDERATTPSPGLMRRFSEAIMQMGLTGEYLAMKYGINRQRQDEFALRSHQMAAQAASEVGGFCLRNLPHMGPRSSRPQGRAHPRPGDSRRHVARSPFCASARIQSRRRLGHRGKQFADQRRSDGALGDVRRQSRRAGAEAFGANQGDGGGRCRSVRDGHRPGPGDDEGAGPCGAEAGRHRLHRSQRSLRRAGPVGAETGRGSTKKR